MDFLTITDPAQGANIAGQWIERPRYGLHLRLGKLAEKIIEAVERSNSQQATILIAHYFSLSGFDITGMSGVKQLSCLTPLLELNNIKMLFAFQGFISGNLDKPPYDYDGRNFAWWVHKLATRYGWTAEYIFNLWPEEAAAYLQEIIISEYDERNEARSLSKMSYEYNKTTQKLHFRPIPIPNWMEKQKPPQPRRIHRDMLPVGNVIDLGKMKADDFEMVH